MWLTSQDDEFRAKRDAILRLYYETPADEHIVCVDEENPASRRSSAVIRTCR